MKDKSEGECWTFNLALTNLSTERITQEMKNIMALKTEVIRSSKSCFVSKLHGVKARSPYAFYCT
jgi:hypothetical protein